MSTGVHVYDAFDKNAPPIPKPIPLECAGDAGPEMKDRGRGKPGDDECGKVDL